MNRQLLALLALILLAGGPGRAGATALCQAGVADGYATVNGAELTAAAADWLLCLSNSTCCGQGQFDECSIDHYLGQSFNLQAAQCTVDTSSVGAGTVVVLLHLKGESAFNSNPTNDYVALRLTDTAGASRWWAKQISGLQCLRTGGLDCSWSTSDTATFVLDLANLPAGDFLTTGAACTWAAGVTRLLPTDPTVGVASVDVGVTDDTCVDFIQLRYDVATPVRRTSWGGLQVRYR